MEVLRKTQEDLTSGQSQLDTMSQTINKETVSLLRQYHFNLLRVYDIVIYAKRCSLCLMVSKGGLRLRIVFYG